MTSTDRLNLRHLDEDDENKLRALFDDILNGISINNDQYLIDIVNELTEKNFASVDIIDHAFFVYLRNTFIDHLQNAVNDYYLPCRIGQFFHRLIDHVNNKNLPSIQQFFANSDLIECLIESLKNLSSTSDINLIASIEYMIDTYQKLQEDRVTVQDDPILLTLIMPITDFAKSPEYKSTFFQLSPQQKELTHYQKLVLITCPRYVGSHWGQYHDEVSSAIVQEVLSRSPEILERFLPSIDQWETPLIWCIFSLILLCQYCANQHLLSAYDIYHKKLLDYVLDIVQGKELWQLALQKPTSDQRQKRASQLFCYATLYIYTMTFSPELRDKLKEHNTTPILLKLTQANYDKTQFHAYRALAAILTDNDIKQLANPAQITTVFITYMKKSIDESTLKQRRENLLLSLKSKSREKTFLFLLQRICSVLVLIQHDQIKEEFVRQIDGISLLLRCATESQFDGTKTQLRALKILMSLTFNNDAKLLLQKNPRFIEYLRTLATLSVKPDLQKLADSILWRLFPKDQPTDTDFQYDAMISYSHKDKDICHRIHKALVADNFRVWIDLERMHGIMIQAMADAVEQSRCVIICMSDNYCVSPYCRAEAQFAFEKQRGLIPIRVQTGYKPQGWLAFLISGRMYVDFMKMNFDAAYNQLKSEFHQNHIDAECATATTPQPKMIEAPATK